MPCRYSPQMRLIQNQMDRDTVAPEENTSRLRCETRMLSNSLCRIGVEGGWVGYPEVRIRSVSFKLARQVQR